MHLLLLRCMHENDTEDIQMHLLILLSKQLLLVSSVEYTSKVGIVQSISYFSVFSESFSQTATSNLLYTRTGEIICFNPISAGK